MNSAILSDLLGQVSCVLVETSHPGNVGAAARAMKVMGLTDLRLVAPRFENVANKADAIAFASGALDILREARVFATLNDALSDTQFSIATAMVTREFSGPVVVPAQAAQRSIELLRSGAAKRVALVFGKERYGLSNEEVLACSALCQIPTNPDYGSLNLAQAVQVMTYALRVEALQPAKAAAVLEEGLADHAAITGMLTHLEQAAIAVGYLDPAEPKRLMPRLASLFARTQLTQKEVDILRGIAKHAIAAASRTKP
ncbi:MAG: RNA methyltransferase [Burkholderiaceae bacterium]